MLYLIMDLTTGEIVDKANNADNAEKKCSWLEETHAYIDNHVFGYRLATIKAPKGA